jgi:hypothetical protein
MPQKKHKAEEIVAKLRQVNVLLSQGKTVGEAVRSIGVLWTALRCKSNFDLQTSIRHYPVIGSAQMGNPLAPASIAGRP